MNSKTASFTAVLVLAAGMGSAHAEYRCDPPSTQIDRNACQAAAEGPQALRQYVQRMRWLTTIQFSDYVNKRTIDAWEAMRREETSNVAAVTPGRTAHETSNPSLAGGSSPEK